MERLTYKPVPEYDSATAFQEIDSGIPNRIVPALLSLAFYNDDWHSVQNICANFSDHPNAQVRGIAILCFGYIARFHASLDTEFAVPIVINGLTDSDAFVRENADAALDDILMFCIPEEYNRTEALELLRSEQIDKNLLGLFAIAKGESQAEFAQRTCIESASHANEVIRGQALKGFATIVWEHRPVDVEKVMGVLSAAASKAGYEGECARTAIACIETYLGADDGV